MGELRVENVDARVLYDLRRRVLRGHDPKSSVDFVDFGDLMDIAAMFTRAH